MRRLIFGFLAVILLSARSATAALTLLHPQDGPHVDLKFELRSDAFVADISMNLVFLDYIMDTGREQPDKLEASELEGLLDRLQARMAEVCRVTIAGAGAAPPATPAPTLAALAMNDPDESLLPLFPRSGLRGLRKIKFTLSWPVAGGTAPKSVSIVWQAFPPDELSTLDPKPPLVLAAELTAEGVRSQLEFRSTEPEFIWRSTPGGMRGRLLAVPEPAKQAAGSVSLPALAFAAVAGIAIARGLRRRVGTGSARRPWIVAIGASSLAVACAWSAPWLRVALPTSGPSTPTSAEAIAIFGPLHANLYRAFDFSDEVAVYDALAESVDGPLLEDLYLTIHRSLVAQEEGGAMSRVRAVRELENHVDSIGLLKQLDGAGETPGFVITCRYQVDGRVTHWGHSHDRTNEYRTRYTVLARPSGWRIAETEVLEQSRVDGVDAPAAPAPTPAAKEDPNAPFDA
ncbi:MAG: hypothetical protein SGJ09_16050 [Phycisphaerae bacterium]|nr:hypothetical protein [Phycisphaerae bacterium]